MRTKREIIYVAGFLVSIPIALTAYINSSFLEAYSSASFVGILYAIASIATILVLLQMPKILTWGGIRRATTIFSLLTFTALIFLASGKNAFIVYSAFILFFTSSSLLFACLDIFIEDLSKRSSIGKFRGWYLMILNGAWVVAQMISGSIIAKSSFTGIYIFSAGFMFLVYVIFSIFLHDYQDPIYKKVPIKKTARYFLENKNFSKIYFLNFILKFFFTWMIIYTPIYLHEYIGFTWQEMGIIFTIMLLPFVILDYPLGKISDKIGEKRLLMLGFSISALFTILIPLVTVKTLWIWAAVLFFTRVGAATIEVMSESYFFKSVTEENADAIGFFRNTSPLSFIVAPILAILILLFVPSFEYIFFVLAAILLTGLFVTLRLRDVK